MTRGNNKANPGIGIGLGGNNSGNQELPQHSSPFRGSEAGGGGAAGGIFWNFSAESQREGNGRQRRRKLTPMEKA